MMTKSKLSIRISPFWVSQSTTVAPHQQLAASYPEVRLGLFVAFGYRFRLRHLRDRTVRGSDKHPPSGGFGAWRVALSTDLAGAARLFVPPVQRRV